MEPLNAARGGPLLRCREDGGLPTKLVGERDVFSLPATEELCFELEGSGVQDDDGPTVLRAKMTGRDTHAGVRVRLTSHRLLWRAAVVGGWLAVRLDAVASVEGTGGGVFRPRRCELNLRAGGPQLAVRRGEGDQTDELLTHVRAALAACGWREGSYEEASMGGLQRIMGKREVRQQAVGETLDLALADLESLRQHAAQTVAAARQVATALSSQAEEGAGLQQLLDDFGLLAPDGTAVVKGGHLKADIEEDVSRVCKAALERRGGLGMLLAHDVFCLVNRARGTALVSPEEVMAALRRCARPGGPLRLRTLGSNSALAVSLSRTNDRELDAQLVRYAEAEPLTAFGLAKRLGGLTAAEAQHLLRDAEARAALVRDEAPEGVYYYPNFFEKF